MRRQFDLPCLLSLLLCAAPAAATDTPEIYGKVNISRDFVGNGADEFTSNVSRIGIRAKSEISDDISVIFQVEQEVDLFYGGLDPNTLFGMRNSFVGVDSPFGRFLFGAHDTPLKRAQGKIDLFNDFSGDIKGLVAGEVRPRDSYMWQSPTLGEQFSLEAMYVPKDGDFDASTSLSLGWAQDDLSLTFAVDSDMRRNERAVARTSVYDSYRGVATWSPGDWQLGLLVESTRQTNANTGRETGYVASLARSMGNLTFKGQWGQSDIFRPDQKQMLAGADYNLSKNTKLYGFMSASDDGSGNQYGVSFGGEVNF